MSSCPELKYTNVSASAWQCCKSAVAQYVQITGNQGQASSNGVTVQWNYDPAALSLSLQCLDKPFIISCGYVNGKIDEAVKACLGK